MPELSFPEENQTKLVLAAFFHLKETQAAFERLAELNAPDDAYTLLSNYVKMLLLQLKIVAYEIRPTDD